MSSTTPQPGSSSSSVSSTTHISIPITAPAGGVLITQPAQTAQPSFYKIAEGQQITFGWNFTSLYVTPTSLTISAVCDNGNTYPVGPTDGVIPGTATQVVWDVYSYQTAHPTEPLAQASYTLLIMDQYGTDSPRLPGQFAPNTGLRFAMYSPQSYTPLESWTCSTCSGALSTITGHPAFTAVLAALMVMIISGWGLLRRS